MVEIDFGRRRFADLRFTVTMDNAAIASVTHFVLAVVLLTSYYAFNVTYPKKGLGGSDITLVHF